MVRQLTTPRRSFADSSRQVHCVEMERPNAAAIDRGIVRLIVAPLALAGVLLGGALFVILLPVCGIASIAQGVATYCWRLLRSLTPSGSHRPAICH